MLPFESCHEIRVSLHLAPQRQHRGQAFARADVQCGVFVVARRSSSQDAFGKATVQQRRRERILCNQRLGGRAKVNVVSSVQLIDSLQHQPVRRLQVRPGNQKRQRLVPVLMRERMGDRLPLGLDVVEVREATQILAEVRTLRQRSNTSRRNACASDRRPSASSAATRRSA